MVAGALRDQDGRWLMHRRPAHKQHGGLWEFPGGKVEPGETPTNALVRELHEELGITADHVAIQPAAFAQSDAIEGGPGLVILLYTVTGWSGVPAPMEAGADIAWFTSCEVLDLERPPLDRDLCAQIFAHPDGRIAAQ